ncbi:hypothetical protein CY0110_15937 [Crocosphaera chwakensis CCY0110]|uniref:Uncharacterized protein n=1 Tax=Crocosphaera chwakensis CCY0110 TaxID=391612 RepID=A3IHL9_9CHRO|nr:hypothetical protein CY0110_15937 [Crocosphaera chwakensis CCY0110]
MLNVARFSAMTRDHAPKLVMGYQGKRHRCF